MSPQEVQLTSETSSRRRNDALIIAIRRAVKAEIADKGYYGVTFEGVARRAKTSKPVLYRRYRSRVEMVFDALAHMKPYESPICTHSLREDLLGFFEFTAQRFYSIGIKNYRSMLAEADDELFDAINAKIDVFARPIIDQAINHAQERGELGPVEIPEQIIVAIFALVRNEIFFSRNQVDRAVIGELLDTVYLPLLRHTSFHDAGKDS